MKKLLNKIINRMDIEVKYRPVIHSYIRQRIFIRMKYLNNHNQTLAAKRKAKLKLQRIQKIRRLMT